MNGTPNIYIGTFVWILVPIFFLSRKISIVDKIRWGSLLLILFISMQVPILDIIWHGFDSPNSFYYRYSFIFSFILFYMSLMAYQDIKDMKIRTLFSLYTLTISLILIDLFYINKAGLNHTLIELTYNSGAISLKLAVDMGGVPREHYTVYDKYKQALEKVKETDETIYYRADTDIDLTFNVP